MARRDNNGKGLLIDTWHWKYKGVESALAAPLRGEGDDATDPLQEAPKAKPAMVKNQVLEIEVRMLKKYDDGELPRVVNSTEFVVSCKELDIVCVGTDLEVLRQAV